MIKVELTKDQIGIISKEIEGIHIKNKTKQNLKKLIKKEEESNFLKYLETNFEMLIKSKFYEKFNSSNPHFEVRKNFVNEDQGGIDKKKAEELYEQLFKKGEGRLSAEGKLKDLEKIGKIESDFESELSMLKLLEEIQLLKQENTLKRKEFIRKRLKGKLEHLKKGEKIPLFFNELWELKEIFNYDQMKAIRHRIMVAYNIKVCPYCQRNYITSYSDNDKEKTTADLDHFFPKSIYPYLSLSLYNFIPSCQICNSRMKLAKEAINVVYPFEESFDELGAKFKIKDNKDLDFFLKSSETDFEVGISLGNVKPEKVKKSIDLFKLDKIYKVAHNNYIQDMLKNIQKEPSNRIKLLNNDLKELMEKFSTEEKKELRKIDKDAVLAPYRFKYENGEPLGKLTKDILESYRIIEKE